MKAFLQNALRRLTERAEARAAAAGPASGGLEQLISEGQQLEDAGAVSQAAEVFGRAVKAYPEEGRAHLNLGNALRGLGREAQAVDCYHRASALMPGHAGALLNLGTALLALRRPAEAESAYRRSLKLRPDWAEAWTGLACALEETGQIADAARAYEQALAVDPAHSGANANLAGLLERESRVDEAATLLASQIERRPDDRLAVRRLADIDRARGELASAVAGYRRLLAARPDDLASHSNLLLTLGFMPEATAEQLLAEHRAFGDRLEAAVQRLPLQVDGAPDRRLRVGYVSPDLRRHSVACFIEPVLRHHDRAAIEVHCYFTHDAPDDLSTVLRGLAEHWHDVASLDDDALARRIQSDRIDILIDLSGHTAGHRLGVFARKPAPVQISWLGYLCTTGLRAMDYRLCDAHTDPPGEAEHWQVETPARMPNSQWCYQPQIALPDVTPLPRLRNGFWTFGSFNQFPKLNAPLLRAWAAVLAAVPGSHLRILSVPDGAARRRVQEAFVGAGIDASRVQILGRLRMDEYFAEYREVDIALDSLPYNGGTTSCDALLMGVPVATVAGRRSVARGGVSLLRTLELQDWIADSIADVPRHLAMLTADVGRIAALRQGLRARMRASPLMDGPRFTRDLETVLREAWRRYCASAR